jgi:hypothetical protein
MKRNLSRALAVAAAALVLGASAYAQVTVNGYYRVGGRENIDASGNQVLKFDDRIRLNLSYAAADDMFGFKARLQANSSGTTSGLATLFLNGVSSTISGTTITNAVTAPSVVKYAMGYAKFFDGQLKVTGGLLSISDYQVYENIGNIYLGLVTTDSPALGSSSFLNSKTGVLAQAWPIEGLSVAAVTVADGSAIDLNHFGLDAYYLLPGFGKAILNTQLGSYSATAASASNDLSKSFVSAGFQYSGFAGLSATGALRYNGAAKNAVGAIAIVEYSKGPLFADLSSDLDFTNAKTYLEGEVSYVVLPQLKVRGYGAFDAGAKNNVLASSSTYTAGADLVFPVGKGELMAGVNYGDKSSISFPILVKANF